MKKAILMSIQPKWLEKILNGEKTIEIRKSIPKELPIDVYLYCTGIKTKKDYLYMPVDLLQHLIDTKSMDCVVAPIGNNKVVAKFTLRKVDVVECSSDDHLKFSKDSCLTQDDFINYCNGKDLYALHISDLVIFDKPKELKEFYKIGNCEYCKNNCCYYNGVANENNEICCCDISLTNCKMRITRPPQSWQYVEVDL